MKTTKTLGIIALLLALTFNLQAESEPQYMQYKTEFKDLVKKIEKAKKAKKSDGDIRNMELDLENKCKDYANLVDSYNQNDQKLHKAAVKAAPKQCADCGDGGIGAPLDGGLLTILGAMGISYLGVRRRKKKQAE